MQIVKLADVSEIFPEMIVHFVRCVGVAHNAMSHHLEKTQPGYFKEYKRSAVRKQIEAGDVKLFELPSLFGTKHIVMCAVGTSWTKPVQPQDAKVVFQKLHLLIAEHAPKTVLMDDIEGAPSGWIEKQLEHFPAATYFFSQIKEA